MSSENSFIGKALGNYRITAEIGSGSFGNVYQGQHTILTERTVAIKQLHSHLGSPEEREQFLEEARLLERLKHQYILHIFDVGIHDGFPYLVAEYAPNGSLRDRLNKLTSNLLPTEEALTVLSQVGQGLYYAHQQNVIHRDLKPANILFNAQGNVLLADFGIATTLSTSIITHAAIMGTPPYMAPEQFQGSVSKESDQYSLGCIAYELFTGRVPFTASDFFAMGFDHITKAPTPPTQLNPHLPLHIERAILKALAKQRGDRHADVNAFIAALHIPADQQSLMFTIPYTHTLPASGPLTPISMLEDHSHAPTINHEHLFHTPQTSMEQKTPRNLTREAQINQGTRPLYNPEPVTPIPHVNPSFPDAIGANQMHSAEGQEPLTPLPPTSTASQVPNSLYSKEPVTPIPLSEELITGVSRAILLSNKIARSTGQSKKKSNATRKWALIAVVSLLIIAINIGAFYYVFPHGSSQSQGSANNPSTRQSLTTTTQGITSTRREHQPPTNSTPIPSFTGTTVPNTVATNTPATISSLAPTATPTPSPTPGQPETVTIYFINGMSGVSTTHTYHGSVSITVSGTGREAKYKWYDALYQYTDPYGNPMTPYHTSTYPGWTLWINGGVADNYVNPIPSYNSNHSYSFTIHLQQAGYLTFAIGDTYTKDNTGYLSLTVTQQN